MPGGRGVEGWCGGTGRHSVGKARHRHGKARECHGMARDCHGPGTADGVPRTFQNNLQITEVGGVLKNSGNLQQDGQKNLQNC